MFVRSPRLCRSVDLQKLTQKLLLLILTPGLGEGLTQLHAHRVEALEHPLLPLALHLRHVGQGLPHPAAVTNHSSGYM